MTLEQKEFRKKRKQRKAKTEKNENRKNRKKNKKTKQKKSANTTKFNRKTKFEDFNETNGATYPQAKTTLRRGGSGTQQKLGANSTTKTTKPRKFTRKVSP